MPGTLIASLHAVPAPREGERSDGELLDRFVRQRDDEAFAELLARHGSLVYGVCRRLVGNAADADDVCQTAFLLLARKASGLWRERSVAGWLVGVVRRLAADVRKVNRRRQHRETQAARQAPGQVEDASLLASGKEVAQLLDEELASLPGKYREPLLLCCFEGMPKAIAAARLGWPEGTVAGRVSRGKALLRARLERRGVVPAVALALLGGAAQSHAAPPLPAPAVFRTALTHPGRLRPLISVGTYSLYRGALQNMWITKAKLTAGAALAVLALAWLGWGLLPSTLAQDSRGQVAPPALTAGDEKQLQGQWHCVGIIIGGGVPEAQLADAQNAMNNAWIRFTNDKVELSGSPSEGKPVPFKLNSSTSPKQIDLVLSGEVSLKGLYSVEGGVLMIRFNEGPQQERPTTLAVDSKSVGGLLIFQRERPRAVAAPAGAGGGAALAREANATAAILMSNMRQIGIAQHMYMTDHTDAQGAHFAGNLCDKAGKPLLSWRVRLLPYLDHDQLYKQFKLDEPWDSEHNKPLLKKMPKVFSTNAAIPEDQTTPFRMFVGKGAFENGRDTTVQSIRDGTSNTILFVEAADAVPWTKPDDLTFDPTQPLPRMGQTIKGEFFVTLCDGSTRRFPRDIKPETLKKFITHAGSEVIDEKEWERK